MPLIRLSPFLRGAEGVDDQLQVTPVRGGLADCIIVGKCEDNAGWHASRPNQSRRSLA